MNNVLQKIVINVEMVKNQLSNKQKTIMAELFTVLVNKKIFDDRDR